MRLKSLLFGACVTAAVSVGASLPSQADPVPPGWSTVYDFLVQDVCVGPDGKEMIGVSPADGPAACPKHRNIGIGEPLPYHKNDWPAANDSGMRPFGYHRNDTYPIETRLFGTAVIQSRGFLDRDGRTTHDSPGQSGGGIMIFSDRTVASGFTEDPSGMQFFYGPDCASPNPRDRLLSAWVFVDKSYTPDAPGHTMARLTKFMNRCDHEAYSYTDWTTRPMTWRVRGQSGVHKVTMLTLISDHFGGKSPDDASNLERFYFTRELGQIRWERWQNLARQKRATDQNRADTLAGSGRCEQVQSLPSDTGDWHMVDCREWTDIVPPLNPKGDPPGLWISRVVRDPQAGPYFAP